MVINVYYNYTTKKYERDADISDLINQKIEKVVLIRASDDGDKIIFHTKKEQYVMYHRQDCCESVTIVDVDNDIKKLVGAVVISASVETNVSEAAFGQHLTWTFYKIATDKGDYFTIRWIGESNGYYSEHVDFVMVCNDKRRLL